jgi:hypothetical protein
MYRKKLSKPETGEIYCTKIKMFKPLIYCDLNSYFEKEFISEN